MPRPQFTLRALLVAVLVVAAFFGGMALERKWDEPTRIGGPASSNLNVMIPEVIELRDGTRWYRFEDSIPEK